MEEKYLTNKNYRNWKAKWIWGSKESIPHSFYYFRKEFEWNGKGRVILDITADTRYRLFLNGHYAGYGPIQSQPWCTYYDSRDITDQLAAGTNTIGLEVYYGGHLSETRGGLLAEVSVLDTDGSKELLAATGPDWACLRATAWQEKTYTMPFINRYAPSQEMYDRRKEPEGWKETGFLPGGDDIPLQGLPDRQGNIWKRPCIIGGHTLGLRPGQTNDTPPGVQPWSVIQKRDIPYMTDTPIIPESISAVEECAFLVNRFRADDLGISLSQAGAPLKHSRITGTEHLLDKSRDKPALMTCGQDGVYGGLYNPSVLLDFGRVITAFFELEVEGRGGETIEIGYSERLVDGRFNISLECPFAESYTLKNGRQKFRSYNWRGFRYVRLIIKNAIEPLALYHAGARISTYPFEERGGFNSTDSKLNDVFDICRYTVRLCSNESTLDTPWREQSQWVGDTSAVTMGGIYACFGDTKLPGKYIHQSSCNQFNTGFLANMTNIVPDGHGNVMPDYNLWWLISVWEHYLYTGDEKWINHYYPVISKMMMSFYNYVDKYGMLNNMPCLLLLDWAFHDRVGQNCFLNALFYGAMDKFIYMARFKGDKYLLERTEEISTVLKHNFSARFFSEEKGCFVEANKDGILSENVSESANMLSIWFGLCNEKRAMSITDKLLVKKEIENLIWAEPFMSLYTLKALHKLGKTDLALEIIKERWFERMIETGARSTYEEWSQNGSYRHGEFLPIFRSHSHAWSAGPAEFLIKHLGGISIEEPGCTKVKVEPFETDFDYKLAYPLPQGEIRVERRNGKTIVELPKGVTRV
jgi:alpha-L-rhamnosidase